MNVGMGSVSWTVLLGIISSLIATGLIYTFRNEILDRFRRFVHYAFDTTGKVNLKRIDKYNNEPDKKLDHELFKLIQEETSSLCLDSISDNRLRFEIDELAVAIEVLLEADPGPNMQNPVHQRREVENTPYKLTIETSPAMTFGYRRYTDLERFRTISSEISKQANRYCFDSEKPIQSFAIGEMDADVPAKQEQIDDEDLGLKAQFRDSQMIFNFSNPENLTQGIKSYFQPFN